MKEEGFVRAALEKATSDDGRWIAGQSSFNFPDDYHVDRAVMAAVVTAIGIYNIEPLTNILGQHIKRTLESATQGEIKSVMADVDSMLALFRNS